MNFDQNIAVIKVLKHIDELEMKELNDLKNFCKVLADESGKVIRQYWRTALVVDSKADSSPVTIADKKSEELMREMIMKEFPDHGILGEEFGEHKLNAEYQWVLDLIDGTKSFICGTPTFGTLIALLKNGNPILGVINLPILNELLIGDNISTELNGRSVLVRECSHISSSVLLTSDHLTFGKYRKQENFEKLVRKVKLYRMWGDCFGYYLLSTGFADIMIDPIMSKWDLSALIPIVIGAGGVITDYYGNDPMQGDSIIASSGTIHNEIVHLLNQ